MCHEQLVLAMMSCTPRSETFLINTSFRTKQRLINLYGNKRTRRLRKAKVTFSSFPIRLVNSSSHTQGMFRLAKGEVKKTSRENKSTAKQFSVVLSYRNIDFLLFRLYFLS